MEDVIARGIPFVAFGGGVPTIGDREAVAEFKFDRIDFGEVEELLAEVMLWGDRVLIRQLSLEQIGEIALPEIVQHTTAKIMVGVVVKVGDECDKAKEGMIVYYPKYATSDIPWAGVEALIIANEPNLYGELLWEDRKWRID